MNFSRNFSSANRPFAKAKEKGAAALEYIIVSAFGVLLSLTAIAFLTKVAKEKFEKISVKTGVSADGLDDFDL